MLRYSPVLAWKPRIQRSGASPRGSPRVGIGEELSRFSRLRRGFASPECLLPARRRGALLKRCLVLIIILLVFTVAGSVSAPSRMQFAYGDEGDEVCLDCIPLDDGAVLVGQTTSFGAGSYDFLAIRTDLRGTPL